MNILITGASGAQAYKLEKEISYAQSIIFADSFDLPEIMLKSRKFIKIPQESSPSYAHQLLTICLDLGVEQVYPLRKLEIQALSESRQLFDEYGIKIMVPQRKNLEQYFGSYKTGTLTLRDITEDQAGKDNGPDRGAFLFNPGAHPDFQILTVD